MAGLREDIELDVSAALRDVDKIEAALGQTAKTFKVELAKATEQLRGPNGQFVAKVRVDDGGTIKKTVAGIDDIESESKQAEAASKKLGSSFDGVRTAVAGALTALGTRFVVDQIGEMINAASDLAESQSKVTVVFGDSAQEIEDWADTSATSVGLASQQALEAAGTFGNLFTALGLSKGAAADLSPEVVQLGADLASFNNLDVPDTLEKLRSGLVGEVEPLRALGISFGAADVEAKAMALGLADANGEISEGAKVQARWALITEQSTAASGDFARTSDGLANQQRILAAEIGNARAEIGQRLLPAMLKGVEIGRSFLDFFLALPEPVQNAVLGFAALGIALGPVLLAVGNISRAATGVSAAITGLANLLGTSTLLISGWAAALVVLAAVMVALRVHQQAQIAYQSQINDGVLETVNSMALLSDETVQSSKGMKDTAVSAFLAAGGLGDLGDSARDTAKELEVGSKIAQDSLKAIEEQTPKARIVLEQLAESSGVTKERIVQLANSLGINLANATDDEREKLGSAIAQIAGGVAPTDRLATASETLGNTFATSKEQIDAFTDALDAALGVYLSSEEATIRVRQRVDDLTAAFKDGRKEGETLQQFQDRLTLATHDVTDAVTKEVAALVRDGSISADAASQKQAITSRLLALADTLGGPMAKELREHAFRVAAIPDEKVSNITADTSKAKTALDELPGHARSAGERTGSEFTAGMAAGISGIQAVNRLVDRAQWAVQQAINAAKGKKGFDSGSPSKVGIEIGGFFVEGISIGVQREAVLAEQAASALAHGVGEVVYDAAQISVTEGQRIFEALDSVREAQSRLTWVEADAKSTSEQLARARGDLAAAQEHLNDAVFEGRDASDELTAALEAQERAANRLNVALDGALSALDALNGLRGAQNSLRRAEQQRDAALARQAALPAEIAAAERALAEARVEGTAVTASEALAITRARLAVTKAEENWAAAQADSTLTTDERTEAEQELAVARENLTRVQADSTAVTGQVEAAERRLADLRKEQITIVDDVRDANDRLQQAQLAVVDAQRQLIEVGAELSGSEAAAVHFFETIARQAGLSQAAIDALVASIREAVGAASTGVAPPPLDANGDGRVTREERQAHATAVRAANIAAAHSPGDVVTLNGRQYVVDASGQLVPLTTPLPQVQPIAPPSGRTTTVRPGTAAPKSMNVQIFPKTAVYDEKQTAGTLHVLEVLS